MGYSARDVTKTRLALSRWRTRWTWRHEPTGIEVVYESWWPVIGPTREWMCEVELAVEVTARLEARRKVL